MIRLILRTERGDHGITFWREPKAEPSEVHDVTGGRATLGLKRWGRRDRNKPVTDLPRRPIGFRGGDQP